MVDAAAWDDVIAGDVDDAAAAAANNWGNKFAAAIDDDCVGDWIFDEETVVDVGGDGIDIKCCLLCCCCCKRSACTCCKNICCWFACAINLNINQQW